MDVLRDTDREREGDRQRNIERQRGEKRERKRRREEGRKGLRRSEEKGGVLDRSEINCDLTVIPLSEICP